MSTNPSTHPHHYANNRPVGDDVQYAFAGSGGGARQCTPQLGTPNPFVASLIGSGNVDLAQTVPGDPMAGNSGGGVAHGAAAARPLARQLGRDVDMSLVDGAGIQMRAQTQVPEAGKDAPTEGTPSDAVFDAMVSSGAEGEKIVSLQSSATPLGNAAAHTPGIIGASTAPMQTVNEAWANAETYARGPKRPITELLHGRFRVNERYPETRVGNAMGSKNGAGATKPPCGNGCGEYCAHKTREDLPGPRLTAPKNIAFRTDPGGYSVAKDGTTPCECGTVAAGGGPSVAGTITATGISPFVGPTSVFGLAMMQPNISRLTDRLVKSGIVRRPPSKPRCCQGAAEPCLCSYIGPFLARAFRDYAAPWRGYPRQTFNDVSAGLNQINEHFENSVLSALYNTAATQQKIAYDKAAGKRKFLNYRGVVERNIRGGQATPPPELYAGNYYAPVNGESGSISRTLSGPSSIYQNAMFQATGVRVGGYGSSPKSKNDTWKARLQGGGDNALALGAVNNLENARGVGCTPQNHNA